MCKLSLSGVRLSLCGQDKSSAKRVEWVGDGVLDPLLYCTDPGDGERDPAKYNIDMLFLLHIHILTFHNILPYCTDPGDGERDPAK